MAKKSRADRFAEDIDENTPMEIEIKADDGKFYNTVKELLEANEAFAKRKKKKES